MKTLLIIAPGTNVKQDCVFNLLVAETGEHLASHLCSHYRYAKGDLYEDRPERIEEFTKRFGEIEVKFIDETDISEDELLSRNKKWYESLPKEKSTTNKIE